MSKFFLREKIKERGVKKTPVDFVSLSLYFKRILSLFLLPIPLSKIGKHDHEYESNSCLKYKCTCKCRVP